MDIVAVLVGYFMVAVMCFALFVYSAWWLFRLWSLVHDTIYSHCQSKARKELGADIGVSANWIRGDEDRQMMVKALQTLLEGGFDVRGGQWRAEYLRLAEHCMCDACKDGTIHWSDCAVHNMPADPNGPCDCGVDNFGASDKKGVSI